MVTPGRDRGDLATGVTAWGHPGLLKGMSGNVTLGDPEATSLPPPPHLPRASVSPSSERHQSLAAPLFDTGGMAPVPGVALVPWEWQCPGAGDGSVTRCPGAC